MPEDQAPVWRYGRPYVSPNDGQARTEPMNLAPLNEVSILTIDANGNPVITVLRRQDAKD